MSIDPENGKMIISDGLGDFPVSFAQFYEIATELKLREVGKYKTDTDINSIIHTLGDGFKDLSFESGGIFQTIKDEHGHDKKIPIRHFMNEDGEGMYCDAIAS